MKHRSNSFYAILFIGLIGIGIGIGKLFQSPTFPYFHLSSRHQQIPTSIGVIDLNHIKTNSKVFQNFNNDLEGLNSKIHKEILERETKLHNEFEQFKKTQPTDKETSRETLKQKAELDKKVADLERIVKDRRESLEKEFTSRLVTIKNSLRTILLELAEKYGLNLILNKSLGDGNQMDQSIVLYSKDELDLTEEVVRRLDKELLSR